MKKADDDDDDNDDDDIHQGWIIVRDGMYSVADKKIGSQRPHEALWSPLRLSEVLWSPLIDDLSIGLKLLSDLEFKGEVPKFQIPRTPMVPGIFWWEVHLCSHTHLQLESTMKSFIAICLWYPQPVIGLLRPCENVHDHYTTPTPIRLEFRVRICSFARNKKLGYLDTKSIGKST